MKEKFLRAGLGDTVRSRSLTGKPARQLRTRVDRRVGARRRPGPLPMPLQPVLIAEAQHASTAVAAKEGIGAERARHVLRRSDRRLDEHGASRPDRVVLEMIEEFVDTVERLNGLVQE